jgi:hypothetical protein
MNEMDEELTPDERDSLAALKRDLPPSDALERSVLRALAARGLVRAIGMPQRRRLRPLLLLAGAAALFAAGVLAGARAQTARTPSDGLPRYVLFLEGTGEPSVEEEARRVHEYKSWARGLAAAGHLVAGEKLSDGATRLGEGGGPSGGDSVRGFFVIAAADDAQALEIARGCPHLRYGGRIVVRKIAPV